MRLFETLGKTSAGELKSAYRTAVNRQKADAAIIRAWRADRPRVDYRALAAALDRAQRVPRRVQ
jgi:acyl CoA:acetate/3-ketoacid CoA transferase alpha subunit